MPSHCCLLLKNLIGQFFLLGITKSIVSDGHFGFMLIRSFISYLVKCNIRYVIILLLNRLKKRLFFV